MTAPVLETPEQVAERRYPRAEFNDDARHYAAEGIRADRSAIADALAGIVAAHPLFDGSPFAREVRAVIAALRGEPPTCSCGEAMTERRTWSQGQVVRRTMVCLPCENADLARLAREAGK